MNNHIMIDVEETTPSPYWINNIEPFIQELLKKLDINNWELSVLFCNDSFIRQLNKQYRNIDAPTDVLSFEQGDEHIDDNNNTWFSAGDIIISVDTLINNSKEFNVSQDEELKRLILHGILHLKGLNHSDNSPNQEMLVYQEQILASFIENPFLKEVIIKEQ